MANLKLYANFDDMRTRAAQLEEASQRYMTACNRLMELANGMQGIWTGKDQEAFSRAVQSYQPLFNDMNELLRCYASFIRHCASEYDKVDKEITSQINSIDV